LLEIFLTSIDLHFTRESIEVALLNRQCRSHLAPLRAGSRHAKHHLQLQCSNSGHDLPDDNYRSGSCPGNIASVTPRFVQRALIVIPVKINQKGPFDFMVDTGSQVTVIDPLLAAQLDLKALGTVGLISVTSYSSASSTVVDTLEAGSHIIEKSSVFVHDLGQIQDADPRIRGVLGVNFLAHFNLLIDYDRKLLCLDESEAAGEKQARRP
jgi:hypothetical protein